MKNISWCYPKIINKISEGSNDMSGGEIAALIAAVACECIESPSGRLAC